MASKKGKINFVLVGAKHTGKTVLLASLSESGIIVANDEFTLEYIKNIKEQLYKNQFPQSTASALYELNFLYKSQKFNFQFTIDDYDGYYVETLNEKDELTEKDKETFLNHVKFSEGILFLFPYEKEKIPSENLKRFSHQIDIFISLLREIFPEKEVFNIPVVILVNKWDQSPYFKQSNELDEALKYIESIDAYKRAKNIIEKYFENVKFMVGASLEIIDDKPKLKPYNLEKIIDFFAETIYSIFENKVAQLKKENKYKELFEYLIKIKENIKFYKKGELLNILSEIEKILYLELYNNLKKLNYKNQIKILKENKFLYDNLSKGYKNNIKKLVNKTKNIEKKENILKGIKIVSFIIFVSVLFVTSIWIVNNYHNEKRLYDKVLSFYNRGNYIYTIKTGKEYLLKFSDEKIFLYPFSNLKKHLNSVKSKIEISKEHVEREIEDKLKSLKNKSLKECYEECKRLKRYLNIFQSDVISKMIIECKGYNDAYNDLKYINNSLLSNNPEEILEAINIARNSKYIEIYNKLPQLLKRKEDLDIKLSEFKNSILQEKNLIKQYKKCEEVKFDIPDSMYPLINEIKNICKKVSLTWNTYREGIKILSTGSPKEIVNYLSSIEDISYETINSLKEKLKKRLLDILKNEVENFIKLGQFNEEKFEKLNKQINMAKFIDKNLAEKYSYLIIELNNFKEVSEIKEVLNDLKKNIQNNYIENFIQLDTFFKNLNNTLNNYIEGLEKYSNKLDLEIESLKIIINEKLTEFLTEYKKRIEFRYRNYQNFLESYDILDKLCARTDGYYFIKAINFKFYNQKFNEYFCKLKEEFKKYKETIENYDINAKLKLICYKEENILDVDDNDIKIILHDFSYNKDTLPSKCNNEKCIYYFNIYINKKNYGHLKLNFERNRLILSNKYFTPEIEILPDHIISLLTKAEKEILLKKEKGIELYLLLENDE